MADDSQQPFLGIPKDDMSQKPPPVFHDASSTPKMVSYMNCHVIPKP